MTAANVTKGKQKVLLAKNAAGTEWEIIGGVKTRGENTDNPTEDTTSSSTTSEYGEAEWTGFSQSTINISGLADKRTGIVDPITGYTIVGQERLRELAHTGQRDGEFRLFNVDSGDITEGVYNVTNYKEDGDTPGLLTFSATLVNKADVTVSA